MIRIGDFSRISLVSIKTLRYYDEVGLLHPAKVDDFTGYRYYHFNQLSRLYRILALKDLGFSLEQIGHLLDENVTAEQLRGMLKLRKTEIEQRVSEEQERLARVDARLRQIEQESVMNKIDIVVKKVQPIKIASIRDVIPTYREQGSLWRELEIYLGSQRVRRTGPGFTMYHDEGYKESDVDAEVAEPIAGDLPEGRRVRVRTLPAVEVVSSIHKGPYNTMGETIEAVMQWSEANGYRIIGPEREIYLQQASSGGQTNPETLTEIQFPVEKI